MEAPRGLHQAYTGHSLSLGVEKVRHQVPEKVCLWPVIRIKVRHILSLEIRKVVEQTSRFVSDAIRSKESLHIHALLFPIRHGLFAQRDTFLIGGVVAHVNGEFVSGPFHGTGSL
jgi:hypothetical protein